MTRYAKYNNGLYKDKLNKDIRKEVGYCLNCGVAEKAIETVRHIKVEGFKWNEKTLITTVKTTNLEIHHIDGNKANNETSNLTVLCKQCHGRFGHINVKVKGRIKFRLVNSMHRFTTVETYRKSAHS